MILITAADKQPMQPLVLETNDDPAHAAAVRAHLERTQRNGDWLAGHWAELLPSAQGRCVAVAGQEAFVADTPEDAWRMARAAILQYVPKTTAPRIYAIRG